MSTTATLTEKDLSTSIDAPPIDISTLSPADKKELIADAASITSDTTLASSSSAAGFTPSKSFYINTKGIPVLRLPVPPSELEISIFDNGGSEVYKSTRARRSSGNCVLTDRHGRQRVATEYFFGPGQDPVLHILDAGDEIGAGAEMKTVSKWTSRAQTFVLPDGRNFTWEYRKEKGFGTNGKKGTALVMSLEGKRVAMLVRNEETRTPGSKSCSAGNGGELVLGPEVGGDGKESVSEELVVATCLLMLKKEIDRRRTVQFMMLSAAISGGS